MISVITEITDRGGWRQAGWTAAGLVAAVWLAQGLFSKLLGGVPRHLAIVQSVPGLGGAAGEQVLALVGVAEVSIGIWVLTAWAPRLCAGVQSAALLSMNVVELGFARDLLLWPAALIPVNLLFLAAAWVAAVAREPFRLRARLRRHPLPVVAHLADCLTLTYAVPAAVLRPLLPPGLHLDTLGGLGFIAVALVQTESLRPAGWPKALGRNFFLAGYRVFVTMETPNGRRRGLYILRSDADSTLMVTGGNLLTHYNYHRCEAGVASSADRLDISVRTHDGGGNLDLAAHLEAARLDDTALPAESPFSSWREARRFAGPLPFTFDHERETNGIVAIEATRTAWAPRPVTVDVRHISFLQRGTFADCTPRLAAAFHVRDVDYRWERGVWSPLPSEPEIRS